MRFELHLALLVAVLGVWLGVSATDEIPAPALFVSHNGGITYSTHVSSFLSHDSAVIPLSAAGESLDVRHEASSDKGDAVVPKLHIRRPDGLCALGLVRWFDSTAGRNDGTPFALSWQHARAGSMCGATEKDAIKVWTADAFARDTQPRWLRYRYEMTKEIFEEMQSAKETKEQIGFLRRNQSYTLPMAIFAIIALAHGIYLGITEEEASAVQGEEVRSERLAAGQLSQGRIATRQPRAKRKGKK